MYLIRGYYSKYIKNSIAKKQISQLKNGQRTKQTFLQRIYMKGQQNQERCSIPLIIREMQIKTTVRYYLLECHHQKRGNKRWCGCGGKGTLGQCCWECRLAQLLQKTSRRFPEKLKIELPCDPAIPFQRIYPKEQKH